MKNIFFTLIFVGILTSNGCKKEEIAMAEDNNQYQYVETEYDEPETYQGYQIDHRDDGAVEYIKDKIIYTFRDGALTSIDVPSGEDDFGHTIYWADIYNDKPKKIIYYKNKHTFTAIMEITLEKTISKSTLKKRPHNYEGYTLLDWWIKLSQAFDKDQFSELKSGKSNLPADGLDITITVETENGSFKILNYNGGGLQGFSKLLEDYAGKIEQISRQGTNL
ncbi:MAG: hypothetical protein LBL61_00290 [Elusimicrobiota bacterium]|jgi:hypothetical protein|nr:hypothetical protein [Elusimicrobiota bacterium]